MAKDLIPPPSPAGRPPPDPGEEARAEAELEQRVRERFVQIGRQIMNLAPGGLDTNPYRATVADPDKRPLVAALLGQGFVVAYQTILQNRAATERVAEELIRAGELYGDDVTSLLDDARLSKPEIDVLDEASWPVI